MNANIQIAHPDLSALVLSRYLIRKSISPNPRLLADGTIRYFIVAPNNNSVVRHTLRVLVAERGLPYTCERVEFSVEDGAYVDFKVTT